MAVEAVEEEEEEDAVAVLTVAVAAVAADPKASRPSRRMTKTRPTSRNIRHTTLRAIIWNSLKIINVAKVGNLERFSPGTLPCRRLADGSG